MDNAATAIQYLNGLTNSDMLRYQTFVSGLERLLASSIIETDTSERTVKAFRQSLAEYLAQAQSTERLAVEAQTKRLLEYTGFTLDATSTEMIRAARKQLKDAIVSQMRKDALAVEAHFQRIRTTAYLIGDARSMGETHAMRLAYLQNKGLLKHVFVDRAGRRWRSSSFVGTAFRGYYLHMVNDLEIVSLAAQGVTRASLVYRNGRAIAFEIGRALGLPSYADIKRLYLHSNSSALVRGTLSSELTFPRDADGSVSS